MTEGDHLAVVQTLLADDIAERNRIFAGEIRQLKLRLVEGNMWSSTVAVTHMQDLAIAELKARQSLILQTWKRVISTLDSASRKLLLPQAVQNAAEAFVAERDNLEKVVTSQAVGGLPNPAGFLDEICGIATRRLQAELGLPDTEAERAESIEPSKKVVAEGYSHYTSQTGAEESDYKPMKIQELKFHALRRLYELAEAKGYDNFFSLDEITAEAGFDDPIKVLRLGEALEADGLVTLTATHSGTEASINISGIQAVEEGLGSKSKGLLIKSAEAHISDDPSDGMQVFISHSSKDESIAKRLADLLRAALNLRPSEIRCTSVDGHRLEVGADTGSRLRHELIEARLFIGIISASSMSSAWVLFELGARWGAGKVLAPVLAPGATTDLLKGPLATLNALSCSSSAQLHQLIQNIGRHLRVTPNSPDSYQGQIDALASTGVQPQGNSSEGAEGQSSSLSGSDFLLLFRRRLLTRLREDGDLTVDLRRELEGSTPTMSTLTLKEEIRKLASESRIEIVEEGSDLVVLREPPLRLEPHLLD